MAVYYTSQNMRVALLIYRMGRLVGIERDTKPILNRKIGHNKNRYRANTKSLKRADFPVRIFVL